GDRRQRRVGGRLDDRRRDRGGVGGELAGERDRGRGGVEADARWPPGGALALGALGGRQAAAGAGVGAFGQRAVRRVGGRLDLGARAPAGVGDGGPLEPQQRGPVAVGALRLADRLAV